MLKKISDSLQGYADVKRSALRASKCFHDRQAKFYGKKWEGTLGYQMAMVSVAFGVLWVEIIEAIIRGLEPKK